MLIITDRTSYCDNRYGQACGVSLAPIKVNSQVFEGKQLFRCLAWVTDSLAAQWGFLGATPGGNNSNQGKFETWSRMINIAHNKSGFQ